MADNRTDHSSATRASGGLKLLVVRREHLVPYEKFLRGIGAPVDRYLERARMRSRSARVSSFDRRAGTVEELTAARTGPLR